MKRSVKIGIAVVAVLVVVVCGVLVGAGNYFVNYALAADGDGGDRDGTGGDTVNDLPASTTPTLSWVDGDHIERLTTTSDDGLSLVARWFTQADSHKWAIAVHGYHSNKESMEPTAEWYYGQGYQVLTPDLRAHGESEGDYIGMGWIDRLDILRWIDVVLEKDPQAQIVLHGVSMGAATVMMTSGEASLPANVKAVVEDCGYTSVWDIFSSELDVRFGLPDFPVMQVSSLMSSFIAGYDWKEASALEQVKKSVTPTLFIHGGADDFVPTDMVYPLYEAAACEKDILVIDGAGHAEARSTDPNAYWGAVESFLSRYIA